MFKYMYNFLHERNLIYKYQLGFQPGHSTIYQIIEIYDNTCKTLDEKENMCMFFVIFLKLLTESGLIVLYTNVKGVALKKDF